MAYANDGIVLLLFDAKKKWTIDMHKNIGQSQNNYAGWKEARWKKESPT